MTNCKEGFFGSTATSYVIGNQSFIVAVCGVITFGWWVNYRRMPLLSWVEVVTQHSMFQKHDLVVQDWTVTCIWCSIAEITTCEFSASLISRYKGGLHELFTFFIPAFKRIPRSPRDPIYSPKLKYAVNCAMFLKNVIEVHYTDDWFLPHTHTHARIHPPTFCLFVWLGGTTS
jgi:hypothetical protein